MAMVFPTSPTVGQVFTSGGRSWVWNGSAWDAPTATNTLLAPYGLEFIKAQTIGTAVTSVTVTGAFNSTYDNYKVIISGSNASVDGTGMRMTLGGSGGSTYFWAGNAQIYDGTNAFQGSNNTTSFQIANTNVVSTTTVVIDFFLPFATQATTYKSTFTGRTSAGQYGGVDNNAISHTSFGFFPSNGTLTGGTIRVYGYRNA